MQTCATVSILIHNKYHVFLVMFVLFHYLPFSLFSSIYALSFFDSQAALCPPVSPSFHRAMGGNGIYSAVTTTKPLLLWNIIILVYIFKGKGENKKQSKRNTQCKLYSDSRK